MNDFSTKYQNLAPYFLGILRIIAAFMFMLAGTSKLFAFPAGMPPDNSTAQIMSQVGIGGILEFVGGIFLLIGLCTRPIAFVLAGEMAVAYFQFHYPSSFWPTVNGGVGAVLYAFVWLYISAAGPGKFSVDGMMRK